MQITSLEQVPAGLTFLLKKVADLEALVHNGQAVPPPSGPVAPKTYTRQEAAKIFQVSLSTLDGYIHDGVIEAARFGTRVRFTPEAIEEAMKKIFPAKNKISY